MIFRLSSSVKLLCLSNWQDDLIKDKIEMVFRRKLRLTEENDPEAVETELIKSKIETVFRKLVCEDDKLKFLKVKLDVNDNIESKDDDQDMDTSFSLLDC